MGVAPRTTAVVPTLGLSRWLLPCLEALRAAGDGRLEILLVAQGERGLEAADRAGSRADRVLRLEKRHGFAEASNRGLESVSSELVALVNDDVVVSPSWYGALVEALAADPRAAAAQGVNLKLDDPRLADGCGLDWNRDWQAVQIGHGDPAPSAEEPVAEIFGVSATAAIYRLAALREVSPDGGQAVFDPRLVSYYEDVDLACRLRAAGHRALVVPSARARHAGSESGRQLALGSWPLIYGNRHLVLARFLGRSYPARLPRIALRDALDLSSALGRGDWRRAAGVVAGWGRASWHLRRYLRFDSY